MATSRLSFNRALLLFATHSWFPVVVGMRFVLVSFDILLSSTHPVECLTSDSVFGGFLEWTPSRL